MKVLFVSSGKKNNLPGPITAAQAASIEVQGISIQHFTINKKGLIGYLNEAFRLRRLLEKEKFVIIHAHYGLTAIVSLLARRSEKLVVSFMGDDLVGSNRDNGKLTRISLLLAKINNLLARWFYDYSIVKSQEMLAQLTTRKALLIPNGVNIHVFQPEDKFKVRDKLGISNKEQIAIFVSKPSRSEKNFNLAQQAIREADIPNLRLVTVTGIEQKNLPDYYNVADLLVLTSFHEGSPNTIKEAMACNCPIVSTDVGDVKWVIGDTLGCYIASFNPKDVTKKIVMALDFSEKKGRTRGRDRIIELGLDAETVAKQIIEVYKKLLAN